MKDLLTQIIGTLAAIVGTSLMFPQAFKMIRTKQMSGVSWLMLLLYFVNCALWLTYGILIVSGPLILSNGIGAGIGLAQLCLYYRYGRRPL